ncbi:aminopeptidase family protein P, partial [Craterilacuibacter sp.]|uniref:aminopeptidase family protein P n=1 Tax=Craterilacuibacter sp. TaxID=2870909 RepID=UPI003F41B3BF
QGAARALQQALAARGITFKTDLDPVAAIWAERPALPGAPVYEHLAPQASETRADKLARVRAAMHRHGCSHHWLSTLDDIAWLLNLRGSDVSYNPVFLAHLLLDKEHATLFVGAGKIDAALAARLATDGITLAPYPEAKAVLAALTAGDRLLLDPARVTLGFARCVAAGVTVIEAINPSTLFKSCKSDTDATHIRATMEQDGAALCEFFAWLAAAQGRETITELTIDDRLSAARARRPAYVCPSFGTIAGFNANGALPHYRATLEAHSVISGDGLLLIDSGGQYLGGTTDITRMVAIGTPSAAQKRDCTLVLKGVINLSRAHFPRATLSPMLDALARAPLWREQIDFGHGTGHGVGYFLNVHEGPQSISRTLPNAQMAMQPGMITSIEPGIYRAGHWGVRIENLVLNVEAGRSDFGDFLAFETLTLCPIDTRCLEIALLDSAERDWLNDYHSEVCRRLTPLLEGDALAWLKMATQAI